jgi:hypothetical protein
MGDMAMSAPSAASLLDFWEAGQGLSPARRALLALSVGAAGMAPSALENLPVGERDQHLLRLRELLFGERMATHIACPECREPLELDLSTEELRVGFAPPAEAEIAVTRGHQEFRFRLPNGGDAMAVTGIRNPAQARELLAERCRLSPTEAEAGPLPDEVVDAFEARAAELDPQADTRIEVCCPACGRCSEVLFDAGEFLWVEISAWARRTLREIHLLASAYGWREQDVLALSPSRRRQYLNLVMGG